MLSGGERVLVAVSGGPDSLALCQALLNLSKGDHKDRPYRLLVGHFNHHLRGAESDADAAFVTRWARARELPFLLGEADVAALTQGQRLSIEEAARKARYAWLEGAAEETGADRVALGHTADDQAETVVLNLLRGAGLDGLAGMPPVRGKFIRPLIEITRAEVEAYCRSQRLRPRQDPSNRERAYLRNRVRHDLLPLLEREYQSNLRPMLTRLSKLLREESVHLRELAEQSLAAVMIQHDLERICLDTPKLLALPAPLRRRVLREAVRALRGELTALEFTHVHALDSILATTGKQVELPGLWARNEGPHLVLTVVPFQPSEPWRGECELAVPGVTEVPELGMRFEAVLTDSAPVEYPDDRWVAWLDAKRAQPPLIVRTWRPGDRFYPLGAPGRMKLHDFFVNLKLPREQRGQTALVISQGEIAWVVGLRISECHKLTTRTRRVLRLRAERAGEAA